MYLGLKAVIVKSFARIHRANLINFGILPLTFVSAADYDAISQGDKLEIPDLAQVIKVDHPFPVKGNLNTGKSFQVVHNLTRPSAGDHHGRRVAQLDQAAERFSPGR